MTGSAARATLPALGYGAAYAVAIVVGRATRVEGGEVSLVWPAAAVAVLWGVRARDLPGRLAAVHWSTLAVVTFVATRLTDGAVELALWFIAVNIALAAVTAAVLGYGGREIALRDPADLGRLVVAVTCGTVCAAGLATAYFAAMGHRGLVATFALFSIRNGVTALAGVAVVLRLRAARWRTPALSWPRVLEIVACVAVTCFIFGRVFWFNPGQPIAFAIMLPSLWISLRFSTTTSTLFLLGAGVSSIWATLLDRGALEGVAPEQQAVLAQGVVGCLAVVVLTLSLFRDSRNDLIGRLRHLALHDPLTGLANRTLLTERLEEAIERGRPGSVGVVLLDLDGFKLVNDAWGHAEGDLLLVEIADRLRACVRSTDTVARLGGDEFVVVCARLRDAAELAECAERIRRCVAEPYGQAADAPYDRITASVGTALSTLSCSARSLLADADHAMYDAKRAGRDRTAPPPALVTGLAAPVRR